MPPPMGILYSETFSCRHYWNKGFCEVKKLLCLPRCFEASKTLANVGGQQCDIVSLENWKACRSKLQQWERETKRFQLFIWDVMETASCIKVWTFQSSHWCQYTILVLWWFPWFQCFVKGGTSCTVHIIAN